MSLNNIILIGNIYFFIFAAINILMPWMLQWNKIKDTNPENNNRIYLYIGNIMLIFIALFFAISGLLYTRDFFTSSLGLFILMSRAGFWILITFLFILLKGLKSLISILLFLHLLICIFIHFIPVIFYTMY